jgi:hypothetical protein
MSVLFDSKMTIIHSTLGDDPTLILNELYKNFIRHGMVLRPIIPTKPNNKIFCALKIIDSSVLGIYEIKCSNQFISVYSIYYNRDAAKLHTIIKHMCIINDYQFIPICCKHPFIPCLICNGSFIDSNYYPQVCENCETDYWTYTVARNTQIMMLLSHIGLVSDIIYLIKQRIVWRYTVKRNFLKK